MSVSELIAGVFVVFGGVATVLEVKGFLGVKSLFAHCLIFLFLSENCIKKAEHSCSARENSQYLKRQLARETSG